VFSIQILNNLRRSFESGKTRAEKFRREQLNSLACLIEENEQRLFDSLKEDLNKPLIESVGSEIGVVQHELALAQSYLKHWMEPKRHSVDLAYLLDTAQIRPEPLGVVLIIGAWNYPINLTLTPLISALAAGNCVVIKPSEIAPFTAATLTDLIPKYLDTSCYQIINGGPKETEELLKRRFDHIFYTGSSTIAKTIMAAASRHLTPVTLELGGKTPCIVDDSASSEIAAKRIVWGKFYNSGQTCVAVDYVICLDSIESTLITALNQAILELYGENVDDDYCKIINDRHFSRLEALLNVSLAQCKLERGGGMDRKRRIMEPTLFSQVSPSSDIMQDEVIMRHPRSRVFLDDFVLPVSIHLITSIYIYFVDFYL
jgi:acyl-CoA reductase-like NAD-dependent aldehyde dehydrogenase